MRTTHKPLQSLWGSLGLVLLMVFAFGPNFASADSDNVLAGKDNAQQSQRGKRGFDGKHRKNAKRGHPLFKILKDLDLSEEQKTQLKKIMETQREIMQKFRKEHGKELKQWHQDMRQAREDEDIDRQKELLDQRKATFKGMPSRKDALNKIKSVLTKEQTKELDQKIKELKKNRGKHKGDCRGQNCDDKDGKRGRRGDREGTGGTGGTKTRNLTSSKNWK